MGILDRLLRKMNAGSAPGTPSATARERSETWSLLDREILRHLELARRAIESAPEVPPYTYEVLKALLEHHLDEFGEALVWSSQHGLPKNVRALAGPAKIQLVFSAWPIPIEQLAAEYGRVSTEPDLGYLNFLVRLANERPDPALDILVNWISTTGSHGSQQALTIAACPPRTPHLRLLVHTPALFNEHERGILSRHTVDG